MLEFSPCLAVHAIAKIQIHVFSHLRVYTASCNVMTLVYTTKLGTKGRNVFIENACSGNTNLDLLVQPHAIM